MAAPRMEGPGMLFVTSKISRKDVLSEETFMNWYDDDHIAEIVTTGGIKDAYRYVETSGSVVKPYLAFYPMADVAFTQGERFRQIRVKSSLLPEPGIIYDLADIDVRYLGLTKTIGSRKGDAELLVTVGIEPGRGENEQEVTSWLGSDHQAAVAKIPGYSRTTIYKLLHARTNAQSRALKGLPTTDEPAPEPPTCQAIHEFDSEVAGDYLDTIRNVGSTADVLSGAKQVEVTCWKLAKAHGEKRFFD
ncbi:hypothetical protein LTR17_017938 [Elasticomyces elasticus]|nr:hypothetical protein LTR17_017938 [Elasticomyces elasticus]